MCLDILVMTPKNNGGTIASAIAALPKSALPVWIEHPSWWRFWRTRNIVAHVNEGCACDLLSDNADWNAETWAMRPEVLDSLAETLQILGERGPDGLLIEALWAGEPSEKTITVSPVEIAALARASKLGTKTTYVIEKAGKTTHNIG